jgi:uncharacterized 2Fe-2S/4Fe-4S cluster protein (DUF4445 family)
MEKQYTITILPLNRTIEAYEGDSLYTVLLVAGLIDAEQKYADQLRLEKGAVSEAEHPEIEAAIFSPAELTEGWLLASERHILGDAVFTLAAALLGRNEKATPLTSGYALAVDLGTATIAAGLINLENMHIPLLSQIRNSQADIALEVGDRIAYSRQSEENSHRMQSLLRQDLNKAAQKLCHKAGISGEQVGAMVLVGNYPLVAILLGQLPPEKWPPLKQIIRKTAAELGLSAVHADAVIYILPAASPQLGADTTAAVLAANLLAKIDEPSITFLIDLGMSSELVAVGGGKLLATSVSALPFEGAGLSSGMPAQNGAITDISFGDTVVLQTMRDARPKGICGAGMLSVVHALLKAGMIDGEGRLLQPKDLPEDLARRFRVTMSGREFVLSWADRNYPNDICVNQSDIHQVQLAKGAIYAACQAMLAELGAAEGDIAEILLAESSSANISAEAALAIGLLPQIAPERIISIGNAAWQGAYIALTDKAILEETEQIAGRIESLDLTSDLIYAEEFIQAMNFGPSEK